MNPVLEDIYRTGKCFDLAGKERKVTGAVPREDALVLQEMVRFVKAKTTLETGVAFGLSTLAICEALKERRPSTDSADYTDSGTVRGENWGQSPGAPASNSARDSPRFRPKHYGVDPEQNTVHGGAALASLKRAGLDSVFELLEGPSHLMLPKLLEKGVKLDLAFIDGWHTFDYTLLDFFYIDKMLRPGGVALLHDRSWPSKQKVMRFIRTHRRYKELPVRSGENGDSPSEARVSRVASPPQERAPVQSPFSPKWLRRVITAKWHWLRGAPFGIVTSAIANRPEIAAFLKLESFEPDHRFFRNF
jgi:predicted O-methyltransferase YrrM